MSRPNRKIDQTDLTCLEDRLRRGIPKWEQAYFIEQVVPQLVERLKAYLESELLTPGNKATSEKISAAIKTAAG